MTNERKSSNLVKRHRKGNLIAFFCFIPMKIRLKWWSGMDGTQFLWLPLFSVKNNTCISICNTACPFFYIHSKKAVTLNLDYELYVFFKYISKDPCWFNSWLTELCIYAFKNSAITITLTPAKGQLISKCLFVIFNSSKKQTKNST